jgi:Winged helix DNA-binding domain
MSCSEFVAPAPRVHRGAMDGNLSAHLATLEGVRCLAIEKDFIARKPRTWVFITKKGRTALARLLEVL